VIRSAGENLADGVVNDAQQVKNYGSLIRTEGRRLSDMVERVMEFAGITTTAPVRMRDDVDIARVVSDAAGGVAPDARERGVVVAVQSASALPPLVGDPDALRSAVQNVISNAVKYSAAGGVVEATTDLDGDRLRVSVSDRGIGIDASDLQHVFKPFYRGRRALDAQIRGTGVGLSVVRHVVDAHQGHITIESRPGEGTRVVLIFPAASRRDGYVDHSAAARATT
jgi:signal transduction histidine kinase